MTTRTDIHTPSQIIPADYNFLFGYAHPSSVDGWPIPGYNLELLQATRTGEPVTGYRDPSLIVHPIKLKYRDTTKSSGNDLAPIRFASIHKNGACDVCGAHHIEGSVFLHVPTGEAVALGWQCAEKLELDWDDSERQLIAGNRKNARQQAVAKAKRFGFLRAWIEGEKAAPLDTAILLALRCTHHIVQDIRARLIRKGYDPSPKQRALVLRLWAAEVLDADKPEEVHVRAPVEDKRQRVAGEVVGVRFHDNAYGGAMKITVKVHTPDGSWLTWGSLPSGLLPDGIFAQGLRGAFVAFDAKLTRSDDSEHFTFFKRPTKPKLISLDSDEARELLARTREGLAHDAAELALSGETTVTHEVWRADEKARVELISGLLGKNQK